MVLTVAHVFDKRPEAASLLNLAALCQACHLRHDLAEHRQQRQIGVRRQRAARDLFGYDDHAGWRLADPGKGPWSPHGSRQGISGS